MSHWLCADETQTKQSDFHVLLRFRHRSGVTGAELGNRLRAGIVQGEVELDIRREDALRVVARHVGQQAVDCLGTVSGPAHVKRPANGALERLDVLVEVGVVMDLRCAFPQVSHFHAFGGDGEGGGNWAVQRIVVVAVDMPAFLDDGRGDDGGRIVLTGVQGDVPLNRVVDAHRGLVLGGVHPEHTAIVAMASTVVAAAKVGLGAFRLNVGEGDVKVDVFRRQALALVADHEGQVALDRLRNGARERHRMHPVDVLLEEEQVQHEVGVVLEDGLALRGGRVRRLYALGLDGERGGNRPVEGVQELAVENEEEEQGEEEMQGLHGHVALRAER